VRPVPEGQPGEPDEKGLFLTVAPHREVGSEVNSLFRYVQCIAEGRACGKDP
jgi:hypothetical protein